MPQIKDHYKTIPQEKPKVKAPDIFDDGILSKGESKRAFTGAAYTGGIAAGIFLLHPGLFGLGEEGKVARIMEAFHALGYTLVAYALFLLAGFFFAKDNIKMIRFAFNWLIIPTIAIWSITEVVGVLYAKN